MDSFKREQYYQEVLNCMPNIVYIIDKNCTLTGCNQHFLNLLHLSSIKEIIGESPYKKMMSNAHWSTERVNLLKRDDIHTLLDETPRLEAQEAPIFNQQGEITYYLSSRIPLFIENKVVGMVVILVDVSKQRILEEQLEKLKVQLEKANAQTNRTENATNQPFEKRAKVLMVEDNSIAQKATQGMLLQLDCQVDVADSGEKALQLFKPGKYDIVLMDIGLEETSGYVVTKELRNKEKGTSYHVPIIALTGYEADVVQYDCIDYSMEGALTKPLTNQQAKQIIQHYVHHIDIPISGLKNLKSI